MQKYSVFDCSVLELQRIETSGSNPKLGGGFITPVISGVNIPFTIKRVFYLYDIPGGESRGAHSHKKCHQLIIAASGAFEVVLDDGINRRTISLNRPYYGLHIPPGIWAAEQWFSSGSICLVLASHKFDESDYVRNYEDYLKSRK